MQITQITRANAGVLKEGKSHGGKALYLEPEHCEIQALPNTSFMIKWCNHPGSLNFTHL